MQRSTLLFILATAALSAAPAHAQWYGGIGAGSNDARLNEGAQSAGALLAQGFTSAGTSVDKRDTGYRAFGGYRIRPYLAVELGYTDLGKYRIRSSASDALGTGALDNEIKIKGADLSLVARYPIADKTTLFGRVGAFASESESTIGASGSIVLFDDARSGEKKRRTEAVFGLGAEYQLTPAVSIRGEWSRFDKVRFIDVAGRDQDASVDFYSVGVAYSF